MKYQPSWILLTRFLIYRTHLDMHVLFCFHYKTPSEKKLRCQLHESLRSKDPAFVKRAIDQFCKSGLEDSGETQQARDRLVYLKLSKGLYVDWTKRDKLCLAITSLEVYSDWFFFVWWKKVWFIITPL